MPAIPLIIHLLLSTAFLGAALNIPQAVTVSSRFMSGTNATQYIKTQKSFSIATTGSTSLSAFDKLAAAYGMTPAELERLLNTDSDLSYDTVNRKLAYLCKNYVSEDEFTLNKRQLPPANQSDFAFTSDLNGLPLLHSRPQATRKIFLDFDGCITSNTYWSWNTPLYTPRYRTNSAAGQQFSAIEQSEILYIWRSVSEDYAAFDVDVTTEDPGVEGLRKSDINDSNFGIRACIGGSSWE